MEGEADERQYPEDHPNRRNVIRDMMASARSLRESFEEEATNDEIREGAIDLLEVVESFLWPK